VAEVYRRVAGKKIEKFIAYLPPVQGELEDRAFEIGVRAEGLLLEHTLEGHASIDVVQGDLDYYVILDDTAGDLAALSIEFGRAGYIDPETGETYGEMEGLYILSQAAHIRRDRTRRLPKVRKRRGESQ
jgi:hypothetical protein